MIKENILWLVVVVVITTILIQVIMQKEYLTVGDYTFEDVTAGAYCVDSVADYKGGLNDSVVYNYCVQLRVRFPEIVTAQCKLESGNYTSELCRNNNNITGMRLASVRPRVAITAMNGYAVYKDWQMCLIDYALWQLYNVPQNCTESDYYNLLGRIYSENGSDYIKEVRKIRNQVFNFKF